MEDDVLRLEGLLIDCPEQPHDVRQCVETMKLLLVIGGGLRRAAAPSCGLVRKGFESRGGKLHLPEMGFSVS
jgi:hypothetical protein